MPIIASFDGITIRMFFRDHPPPHFHAQHGGDQAIITIAEGRLLAGALPPAVMRQVAGWARVNKDALLSAWDRARVGDVLGEI